MGTSASGKPAGFGPAIRRFEPSRARNMYITGVWYSGSTVVSETIDRGPIPRTPE